MSPGPAPAQDTPGLVAGGSRGGLRGPIADLIPLEGEGFCSKVSDPSDTDPSVSDHLQKAAANEGLAPWLPKQN